MPWSRRFRAGSKTVRFGEFDALPGLPVLPLALELWFECTSLKHDSLRPKLAGLSGEACQCAGPPSPLRGGGDDAWRRGGGDSRRDGGGDASSQRLGDGDGETSGGAGDSQHTAFERAWLPASTTAALPPPPPLFSDCGGT
eukprot:NODE_17588_length_935_cov_3.813119.p2 GENE.NODE_17588_length_935_cov_3.813119~~NODE_17588_length_935_cov_3.813119.p2  ORF type:complete len:141 (-),score=36.99 NODE_17588_length_935_cov_3.813119:27-449(-)